MTQLSQVKIDIKPTLTDRQQDVLQWLAEGMTNHEIAAQLGISVHTVKLHVFDLGQRLQIGTRVGMVVKGLKYGYLKLDEVMS